MIASPPFSIGVRTDRHICLTSYRSRTATLYALAVVATLLTVFVLHTAMRAGLYGDGANYFLQILTSENFVHISPYRIGATWLTQWPVVLAINSGVRSIAALAMLHTAGLTAVPTICFAVTTWITRRNSITAFANMLVLCCCYFPTIFMIIGEFHVLYSLFWLSAVLAFAQCGGLWLFAVLLAAGVGMLRSYELTTITGGLLGIVCVANAVPPQAPGRRALWIIAAVVFLAGVPLGLAGILEPRDPANAGAFARDLLGTLDNDILLGLVCLVGLAALSLLFDRAVFGVAAAVVAALASWRFLIHVNTMPVDAALFRLGYESTQRAQVFPVLLGAFLILVTAGIPSLQPIARRTWQLWPLLVPFTLVVAVYSADLQYWRWVNKSFCTELRSPEAGADSAAAFIARPEVKKFGFDWELPTMSVLLRDPGNHRIIENPAYHGWLPFDPANPPNIARFKDGSRLCR